MSNFFGNKRNSNKPTCFHFCQCSPIPKITPISTSSMVVITMLVLPIEDIFAIGILLPLVKPQKILIRFSFYLFCNNNHMDEISQYPPSLPISVQKPNIHPFTKRSMSQYTNISMLFLLIIQLPSLN